MSRSLTLLLRQQPSICSSCLRAFRSSMPAAASLRRHKSNASAQSSNISDMFSEIDFTGPRKVKPIIDRYKDSVRYVGEDKKFALRNVEQLAEGEEIPPEEIPFGPTLPLTEQLKIQMRRVLYPLTLVTAYTDAHDPTTWNAMTISSFNTVAMSPVPLISLNVKFPSTTGQMILDRELFVVNVLCQHINSAKLCQVFNHRPPKMTTDIDQVGEGKPAVITDGLKKMPEMRSGKEPLPNLKFEPKFRPTTGPFKDLPVYRTEYGIRMIPNLLLSSLGCQLRKVVSAGDHKILIAEVMDVYGAIGDRPQERRRFHLQGHRLEREMSQTYRNGKYVRHRTEGIFDVSKVIAGEKVLLDDKSLDYKHMRARKSDPINDI
ncbi:hypothetical protein H072_2095 [Dactylellina haptotyla CBS 200.50]|uniref:Flavin reductase like domain-containing protein n=1 Tax=Dactylellina haptotyla (strain CBS 200.50) TaxID=1284197 RepID=S8ALP2_DACHA|nr:hypothetical protein H072_2095 [Dactylellina haptotyla CBS 200.50]